MQRDQVLSVQVTTTDTPVLARNVGFGFPGQRTDLLRGLSLEVRPGEVVILIGPNGCGKSSLLGLLTGRLRPSDGSVSIFGRDPWREPRLPDVGSIAEPFHPEQSAMPTELVCKAHSLARSIDNVGAGDVADMLDRLNLGATLIDHPLSMLSKGERRREMLATVLLRKPHLILADEPLEGIDRQSRERIGGALREFAKSNGRSVLWVSHHLSETAAFADRLLQFEDGRLVDRTQGRFTVTLSDNSQRVRHFDVPGLHVIPDLVDQALAVCSSVRIEIAKSSQSRGGDHETPT